MLVPAVTTTSISSVCPECGITQKSAKMSCCARGGSWFGNCGGAGDGTFGHTWYEGVRACKDRQFQAVVGQQLHSSQFKRLNMSMESIAVIATAQMFASTRNISTLMSSATTSITPNANKSIITSNSVSPARDTDTSSSKAITARTTTSMYKSANMSAPKSTTRAADLKIMFPVKPIIIKPMSSSSAGTSINTSSHTSACASITAREKEMLLHVVIHTIMILTIFYCSIAA